MRQIVDFLSRFGFALFMALMLVALVCGIAFSQTPEPDGLKLIEREQSKKGMELLHKAANAQPTAESFYSLGVGLLQTGDVEQASQAFEKGLAANNKMPLNYVGKGRVMLRRNDPNAAQSNFEKALDLTKSKNTVVLNAIGEAWLEKTEFISRAKEYLQKSESIQPSPGASLLLGDAFLIEGNGGKAVSNYEYAVTLDVRNPTPYYKLGMVYVRSTNKDAAIESFRKAVALDPGYTRVYKELAELHYSMKNGAEAVKAQEKYIELTEYPDGGLVRMGYYLFMTRDFSKTNEVFEEAYQKGLLNGTGLRYYALSLTENGDYSRSQKIFDEYFAKATKQQVEASDYASYGKVLIKLEQDSLAVIALKESLVIDGKQLPVKQLVAETLYKNKRYVEAVDAYKDLISARSKPTSQDLYSLGRACYFTGQFERADTVFNQLITMQPAMTAGYLWAGRTNANLDPESEKGMAKPYYEKVIELGLVTADKSKNDLKEAYSYLGYYYYVKNDNLQSRINWEKVLALDPQDERAREALKVIKQ